MPRLLLRPRLQCHPLLSWLVVSRSHQTTWPAPPQLGPLLRPALTLTNSSTLLKPLSHRCPRCSHNAVSTLRRQPPDRHQPLVLPRKLATALTAQAPPVAATALRRQLTPPMPTRPPATAARHQPVTRLRQPRTRSHNPARSIAVVRPTPVVRLPATVEPPRQAQRLTQAPPPRVLPAQAERPIRRPPRQPAAIATHRPRRHRRLTRRPATISRAPRILRLAATRAPRLRTRIITKP